MVDKLKNEFIKIIFGKTIIKNTEIPYGIEILWNWINQNYISKQQILNLESLKEEKYGSVFHKGVRNQLRKEIKEEIEKL